MKLSVIIVNHNACVYLKQALYALTNALKGISSELFVVDNASTDRSLTMLSADFPETRVLKNTADVGVAKAGNQALQLCTGEYILMVNPDTISGKDSLEKMIDFMDQHPDAGGLSVRMLSPQGRFIPESIHGLSKSWASFLKLIGFSKHLPKTRLYDRNRKDWVEEFQITEIDILNGACMLLRRSALTDAGLFDERFAKFGYDVDLSYRIRLAGFKNYYFPKTFFINFESRPLAKFSLKYFRYYYGAMFIFAVKYLMKVPEIKVQQVPALFPAAYEVE